MDIFVKGLTFPVTLESLENDLVDGVIKLIPSPTSFYQIFKTESDGIVFEHYVTLDLHSFHFRLSISLSDAYNLIIGVIENRLML